MHILFPTRQPGLICYPPLSDLRPSAEVPPSRKCSKASAVLSDGTLLHLVKVFWLRPLVAHLRERLRQKEAARWLKNIASPPLCTYRWSTNSYACLEPARP